MDALQYLSSLSCELRIIRAKNMEFVKSTGHLFVRCYLSAGNNKRVRINSQEISSKSDLFWDESFSLECAGTKDSMDMLVQGSVVLELRWRSTVPVLGKLGGSRLLGRGEIPWKTVFESPEMEIEQWFSLVPMSRRVHEDVKPPALQVWMKVRVPATIETVPRRKNGRLTKWDECGCMAGGCRCADYEIFALAAALDAF
ncbi:uncharacterized protein LOC132282002 [Cornus florida]|uniref:uncharacterized protein LOC132282002 n=1 Tax=Cornus florida TaxID=4283 RepID=UPI00289927DE|nr:uncharacterized protein LOC132282002 [Cornus florida]